MLDKFFIMKTKSLGKNSHVLTLIDDYSKMCWVYFLKHKDEVFASFRDFKNLIENQSGHSLKCLRTE